MPMHSHFCDTRLEGPILHDASVDGREKARVVKELRLGCHLLGLKGLEAPLFEVKHPAGAAVDELFGPTGQGGCGEGDRT